MDDATCKGCGKPLSSDNAWMYDGCPCNSPAGCNNGNQLISNWRQDEGQRLRHENERLQKAFTAIAETSERRIEHAIAASEYRVQSARESQAKVAEVLKRLVEHCSQPRMSGMADQKTRLKWYEELTPIRDEARELLER